MGDSDELPDNIEDSKKYIEIPHKNELDLGKNLVMRFVIEFMPDDIYRVENIFKRKGAVRQADFQIPGTAMDNCGYGHRN